MNQELDIRRASAIRFLRDGVVTFAALLLVFAALDDITTDNAKAFPVEYTILLACASWLLFVALRLMRDRHYVLGGVSLLALASAMWGQRAIGPGITPGLYPQYVVPTAAYIWFCALTFGLLWRGWSEHPVRHR